MGSVTVNGSKVNFDAPEGFAEGNRKGHTVLLIHGATDNHKIWHHQMEALSKDHSPVSVDLPGHLDSGGEGIDNAEGYRAFVKGLAEALNLAPFVFVGHSMGGSMALDFALHHGEMLKGAIMVGSSPSWEIGDEEIEPWKTDPDKMRRDSDEMYSRQTSSEIKEWAAREMSGTPGEVCYSDLAACGTFDPDPDFSKVMVPMMVVVGDEDAMSIPGSELVAEKVSRAQYDLITACGHPIMIEHPDILNDLMLRFLDRLD